MEAPETIRPTPLPMNVHFVTGHTDRKDPFLGIGFETPQGTNWYFFIGEDMKKFSHDLREQIKEATLGIIVPRPDLSVIPTDGGHGR